MSFFNDVEVSSENSFTAGTIEITIDDATTSVQVNEIKQSGYDLVDIVCSLGFEGPDIGNSDYTCGGIYDIEVEDGDEIYCSFYNETIVSATSTISGCKYNDRNNNGILDSGEESLDGWKIQLIQCPYTPLAPGTSQFLPLSQVANLDQDPGSCTLVEIATTTNGCYEFNNLPAGDYGVLEINKPGWEQTYPLNNSFYYFNLPEGISTTSINFLNYKEQTSQNGSITIIKDAGDSQEEFTFNSNYLEPFSLTSGQSKITTVPSGLYHVYEGIIPDNWYLDSIECVGDYNSYRDDGDGIFIEIMSDEDVICTFYNIDDSEPSPYCGDGTVNQNSEECDDGNTTSGDGCSSSCQNESSGGGGGFFTYTNQGETEEIIVLGEEGEPVLIIEKTIGQSFANNGDEGVEYQIVVANNGSLSAFDVISSDVLPEGFVYFGTDETTKTWDLGDLESGKSVITKYNVDILSSTKAGVYENVAMISASNHDEISDMASLEVREIVVLAETGFDLKELEILGFIFIFLSASVLYLRRKET